MILGGTETSTTLEWIVAALIKSPDVMFKLQNKVREIGKGKSKILEGDYKGLNYEYLPFGIQFAMAVNELAVANVVNNFDFKLPNGERLDDLDMTGVPGISLYKKSPLLHDVLDS